MASFKSTIITQKGHNLIAKLSAGTATMSFTKIKSSNHDYSALTSSQLEALVSIDNIKQEVLVNEVTRINDASVKVSGSILNTSLTTGYYIKTIALYADDPDEGEILYSITVANESDWMPPYNNVSSASILIDLITVVSNAENVTIDVDPNAIVTITQFNEFKENVNTQLSDRAKYNRRINFLLSATPWPMSATDGNVPNSQADADSQLTKYKAMGYDGIVVYVQLKLDTNNNIYILNTIDMVEYYITKAQSLGLSVRCIKVHFNDTNLVNNTTIVQQYIAIVENIANQLKSYNIPYFCVLNEAVHYLFDVTTIHTDVTGLIDNIKNLGYKVGISGLNLDTLIKSQQWLIDCQDIMFPFAYNRISYKGKRTTYQDSKSVYDEYVKKLEYWSKTINKPIIISETGVLPYWEALENPVYFDWNQFYQVDNSGEVQKTFFYGLFNNIDISKYVAEVWVWYPDNMTDSNAFDNCSNFINYYTQGGN